MSPEDWECFTLNWTLCDDHRCLSITSFRNAMRLQMEWYSQRLIANKMQLCINDGNTSEDPTMYFALKMMMMSVMPGSIENDTGSGRDGSLAGGVATPSDPAGTSNHTSTVTGTRLSVFVGSTAGLIWYGTVPSLIS
jgi:hypothetical protein